MKTKNASISFFERYLTVWVILCMGIGVAIGVFLPGIPNFLSKFEYARVSIPIAILIWLMIYPMMMKVDFKSVKNVRKNPKGLFVTWITNWLIKPFTMYGIAWLFYFGPGSPVALATIVGVLVEVPVMLTLIKIANKTKHWFPEPKEA